MDIQTAINRCIAGIRLADRTRESYSNGIDRFIEYLQEEGIELTDAVDDLSIDHFIRFTTWLSPQYSKKTIGVYLSSVKKLTTWLIINKIIQPTFYDNVRYDMAMKEAMKIHEYKLPRFPARGDVDKMLKAVRLYEQPSPILERNVAILEFLASSGCRNNEVINLTVKDIDLENRSTVVIGKGNKERRVWFSQTAADAIKAYWTARKSDKPTDPAFARHDRGANGKKLVHITTTTTRDIVKNVIMLTDIDPSKFSPHYFRHAFAIRVLSETNNLALVQDLLGHENANSTRVYAKIYPDDLKKAHQKIFH